MKNIKDFPVWTLGVASLCPMHIPKSMFMSSFRQTVPHLSLKFNFDIHLLKIRLSIVYHVTFIHGPSSATISQGYYVLQGVACDFFPQSVNRPQKEIALLYLSR